MNANNFYVAVAWLQMSTECKHATSDLVAKISNRFSPLFAVFIFVFRGITVKSTWAKLSFKPCDYFKKGQGEGNGESGCLVKNACKVHLSVL